MTWKRLSLLASTVLAVTVAVPAWASTVQFNPLGGGGGAGVVTIDTIDPPPGNTLSNFLPPAVSGGGVGTTAQIIFQANFGTASLGSPAVPQFVNGLPAPACTGATFCFTIVAAFSEKVATNNGTGSVTFTTPTLGGANQGTFNIYANHTGLGQDLTGNNFVNGAPILTATFIQDVNFTSSFDLNPGAGSQALDQTSDGNNYPSTNSISGTGAFQGNLLITSVNSAFFPNIVAGQTFMFATSKSTIPFHTTNPSQCFNGTFGVTPSVTTTTAGAGLTCTGGTQGVGNVGSVNGINGPDLMLESDSSLVFTAAPTVVPEPATLSLLGLGLIAGSASLRKRFGKR